MLEKHIISSAAAEQCMQAGLGKILYIFISSIFIYMKSLLAKT